MLMQDYLPGALAQLAGNLPCPYAEGRRPATEPTALAAMALMTHGHAEAARRGTDWLAAQQSADGSVGVSETEKSPCWPTALAVLAWTKVAQQGGEPSLYRTDIDRALAWLCDARGESEPRTKEMGHDSTLVGWPWVLGTHSWLEPTAWSVLALKAAGQTDHPRCREAVRLLVDRLLPIGGCNYGNTFVLGQQLRPHLAPTGLVLTALADEPLRDRRIKASLDYMARELSPRTACISLCYGLMGMAAHGRPFQAAHEFLASTAERIQSRGDQTWKLALVALAALGPRCPLIPELGEAS